MMANHGTESASCKPKTAGMAALFDRALGKAEQPAQDSRISLMTKIIGMGHRAVAISEGMQPKYIHDRVFRDQEDYIPRAVHNTCELAELNAKLADSAQGLFDWTDDRRAVMLTFKQESMNIMDEARYLVDSLRSAGGASSASEKRVQMDHLARRASLICKLIDVSSQRASDCLC